MRAVDLLLAAAPHHKSAGIASSVFIVTVAALLTWVAHLKGRFVLFCAMLLLLGALIVGMSGTLGEWMRAVVSFIDQLPAKIASF